MFKNLVKYETKTWYSFERVEEGWVVYYIYMAMISGGCRCKKGLETQCK